MRYLLYGSLVLITLICTIGFNLVDNYIPTSIQTTLSGLSNAYGFPLSYLGFVFSAYAAFEVRLLRIKYVGRSRLPNLLKELRELPPLFLEHSGGSLENFKREAITAKTSGILHSISIHDLADIKTQQKNASKQLKVFKKAASRQLDRSVNVLNIGGFWDTYESLHELILVMDNFGKDERAR